MNILFIILKIIGILLCVILFLALLLLFHPVFYYVKGEIEEKISVKGHIWWLFQTVRLEFQYEDSEMTYRARIFGVIKELQSEAEPEDGTGSQVDSDADTLEEEVSDTETVRDEVKEEPAKDSIEDEPNADKPVTNSHKKSKWREFTEDFGILKKKITDERNHMAVSHLWKELLYLLRHLKPKFIKADMSFSTGDPATTGQVTGMLSLIPALYQYDAKIEPDFLSEEFYVKGRFALKGHIALFHIVRCAIRLICDKNVKRLFYKK